jgi:hypothetical protein
MMTARATSASMTANCPTDAGARAGTDRKVRVAVPRGFVLGVEVGRVKLLRVLPERRMAVLTQGLRTTIAPLGTQ